jgi:hypothetical protein
MDEPYSIISKIGFKKRINLSFLAFR